MKEIYLIRHGRQDIKAFNEDVPLSPAGIRQAELLRERLRDEHYDAFYSSTLKRAVETADILNENWHMDIRRREGLGEIDYGLLTSEPLSVKKGSYSTFFSRLEKREEDLPFPGGENSEMVWLRARPVFRKVEESPLIRILVVCHSDLPDLPFSKRLAFSKHLENTGVTKLLYDEETKLYYPEPLNDHQHLVGHRELSCILQEDRIIPVSC